MPEAPDSLRQPPGCLLLDPRDTVAVAMRRLDAGETVPVGAPDVQAPGVQARGDIPSGHKVAVLPVRRSDPVRKFGQVIGHATAWGTTSSSPGRSAR